MKRLAIVLLFLCLCTGPASAKITCTPPFYFYAILDAVTIETPLGTTWTLSTWPFLPCEDEGSNCVELKCASSSVDCTAQTLEACYSVLVSNCSNEPALTVIRHATLANESLCEP